VLPKIGNPILNMSASYIGASIALTELGPPEIIIALKLKLKYLTFLRTMNLK